MWLRALWKWRHLLAPQHLTPLWRVLLRPPVKTRTQRNGSREAKTGALAGEEIWRWLAHRDPIQLPSFFQLIMVFIRKGARSPARLSQGFHSPLPLPPPLFPSPQSPSGCSCVITVQLESRRGWRSLPDRPSLQLWQK